MAKRDSIDEDLVEEIMLRLKETGNSSTVLIDTYTTMVAKTNFFLLKGLLDFEKSKGFFVALDRPYQNMDYLLKNHGIDREKIWYIDTVPRLPREKKGSEKNVDFVDKTFEIENLMEVFESGKDRDGFGTLDDVDFILIDNLSSMLSYNSLDKVEQLVGTFREMINIHDHLLGCIVMDTEAQKELYDVVKKHVNKVIDVRDLKEEF